MRRLLLAVAVGACLAAVTFALTASATVPATDAGQGSNSITTYTLSNIVYTPNAASPKNIDSITFTLSPSTPVPTSLRARLSSSGTYVTCTNTAGTNNWSCPASGVFSADAATATVDVVAVQ